MSLVCGFNVFNQFADNDGDFIGRVSSEFYFLPGVIILDFSWSGVLFIQDGVVKYRGFVDENIGKTVPIRLPEDEQIIQGKCQQGAVLAVSKSGICWRFSLTCQTWNRLDLREYNLFGTDHAIVDIATSDKILLLLTNMGEVYSYPSLVTPPEIKVTQVTCGLEHCAFLCDSGFVYTWGSSSRGQLGHGDIEGRDEPEELVALSGLGVVSLSAGGWHTCAVTDSGDLYSWGWNHHRQLGLASSGKSEVVSEPTLVNFPSDEIIVKSVACGTYHTVILLSDFNVYGCGSNKWCQLGFSGEDTVSNFKLIYKPSNDFSIKRIFVAHWNTALITEPVEF